MYKKAMLACAVAFGLAIPAQAKELTRLDDTVVTGVESPHRNTAGVILGDTLGGAAAGAVVGGGVVLYDHFITKSGNGWMNNWGRTVAIGAGIGAAVGLVFGVVDAASADRAPTGALVDQRDLGFEPATHVYGMRF